MTLPFGTPSAPPVDEHADPVVRVLLVEVSRARCALPLDAVAEVLPAARVEPVPSAPAAVLGVLNVRGEAVAVLDVAVFLGYDRRPLHLSDRFVLLAGTDPPTALRVDGVHDIAELAVRPYEGPRRDGNALGDLGVALREDGLVVVHDPAAFVAAADHEALRRALAELEAA